MDAALADALTEQITATTGRPGRVAEARRAGGGSINAAFFLTLDDGRRFFVKSNAAPLPGMFEREVEGLRALAATETIRVPTALGCGGDGRAVPPFLVLEAIRTTRPGAGFFVDFGRRLAELHRRGQGERFGFPTANYLGSTPQPNAWHDDWVEFWRTERLGHQLALARRQGLADAELSRLGERLQSRLDAFLAEPAEPPTLLHGDLWSGNYLVDEAGAPVLIDPAVYYGRREADLAMTRLFGGFAEAFYDAYEEAWPLAPGAALRIEIYKLYHLLNHLNLFGTGYRTSCLAILRRFA